MAWQIIVRLSLDADGNSAVRNKVAPFFTNMGLHQRSRRTGTWESYEIEDMQKACSGLRKVTRVLENPGVRLDHLWVYIAKAHKRNCLPINLSAFLATKWRSPKS